MSVHKQLYNTISLTCHGFLLRPAFRCLRNKNDDRLLKEVSYYEQEVKDNEKQLEEMKEDATKDSYDIKRFAQVLSESYMMIPDSKKRLRESLCDLSVFVRENEVDKGGEWYTEAVKILVEHGNIGNNSTQDLIETRVDNLADNEDF
jgi:tubulin-specific chaperone A